MAIIKLAGGLWLFLKGKHANESVDQVAKTDPGYLSWAWREASGDESPDAFHALDDAARANGVDTAKGVRIENNGYRRDRITHDPGRKKR